MTIGQLGMAVVTVGCMLGLRLGLLVGGSEDGLELGSEVGEAEYAVGHLDGEADDGSWLGEVVVITDGLCDGVAVGGRYDGW